MPGLSELSSPTPHTPAQESVWQPHSTTPHRLRRTRGAGSQMGEASPNYNKSERSHLISTWHRLTPTQRREDIALLYRLALTAERQAFNRGADNPTPLAVRQLVQEIGVQAPAHELHWMKLTTSIARAQQAASNEERQRWKPPQSHHATQTTSKETPSRATHPANVIDLNNGATESHENRPPALTPNEITQQLQLMEQASHTLANTVQTQHIPPVPLGILAQVTSQIGQFRAMQRLAGALPADPTVENETIHSSYLPSIQEPNSRRDYFPSLGPPTHLNISSQHNGAVSTAHPPDPLPPPNAPASLQPNTPPTRPNPPPQTTPPRTTLTHWLRPALKQQPQHNRSGKRRQPQQKFPQAKKIPSRSGGPTRVPGP